MNFENYPSVELKEDVDYKLVTQYPFASVSELEKFPKEDGFVQILSNSRKFVGVGFYNSANSLALRLITFNTLVIDGHYILDQIHKAYQIRQSFELPTDSYRLINSESDGLPGLIVDAYASYLIIQVNTLAMEYLREQIVDALIKIVKPLGIYDKSKISYRTKEGLRTEHKVLYGNVVDELIILENELTFNISLISGQKTGYYLDQRKNRKIVSTYVEKNHDFLDLFCNSGGFGIYAAKRSAKNVILVDNSELAIANAIKNIRSNNLQNIETIQQDVFEYLSEAIRIKQSFDFIILDPPGLSRYAGDKSKALQIFEELFTNSIKLLRKGGYIAFFSCEYKISLDDLKKIVLKVTLQTNIQFHVAEHLFQDKDHLYKLNVDYSLYLKGLLLKREE